MAHTISFIDSEIDPDSEAILDLGAVRDDRQTFHSASVPDFCAFIADSQFLCGHNLIHHDAKYLGPCFRAFLPGKRWDAIDTLYLSPLLFPRRPYHALLKDDKLQSDEVNNPQNDSIKAEKLFYDEVEAYKQLPIALRQIYYCLLRQFQEFRGFFRYVNHDANRNDRHIRMTVNEAITGKAETAGGVVLDNHIAVLIRELFAGRICANAPLAELIRENPIELSYALALIHCDDDHSLTPPWLANRYPKINNVFRLLRSTPCKQGCPYCTQQLDIRKNLRRIFGYDDFRTYNGEPLQARAAQAAVDGKSLLAVFPTGGGKSVTFQLPALMAGRSMHGLTVVISPLQSLMKDQVDNLNKAGIVDAVSINGMLNPIERADALRRVQDGSATMLYISPEQLRSKTVETMLLSRTVVRFVIDEAHCFSAWGQDFRVDYLYIGDFIKKIQDEKKDGRRIPVSCFTATAKQKVITDICDYFKRKLDLDLEIFASTATRENLHYVVLFKETEEEKYSTLRSLIEQKDCPTIVYVSRTKKTRDIAEKLTSDGFPALPFNGKMEPKDKVANQEAFLSNQVSVIVATSAFGMGVDKKDVRLVVHYDISDSLENYVQEAGRAGRDASLEADCYVLFNNNDLDKHFMLLNQTKLSIGEIQQVWRAIKDKTRCREVICCSALELARQAGWDDASPEIETRVRTAVAALENAGYIRRGRNVPRIYANSILVKNMQEAGERIDASALFSEEQREAAKRVVKSLISSRSIAKAGNRDAESRVDYLADTLGLDKREVITVVNLMRQESILADNQDMTAYIYRTDNENKSLQTIKKFLRLERFILERLPDEGCQIDFKEWNEAAMAEGIAGTSVKNLRTLLYFYTIKHLINKEENAKSGAAHVTPTMSPARLKGKYERRADLCTFLISELYRMAVYVVNDEEERPVEFSLVGLWQAYTTSQTLGVNRADATQEDVAEALLYLSKIGAMKLEGGFLVSYNGMEIRRLVKDNRIRYKVEDYHLLDEFYKQKIRQIHIVGEYANLMVRDYDAALQFVKDYFQMDFRHFLSTYFKGDRMKEIDRNITPEKYYQLFGELSEIQSEIISDDDSRYIVVAAGPGSGKTRVLVHKLASLLLMEDVKHEQLLMLTFSRAAATEFKKRLMALIGNAANFVEIKTFHSYCFDLLGKIGNLEGAEDVVKNAAEMIVAGEVEPSKIMKRVLVIDEAQDMDQHEFALVRALMQANDDMRIIAVGDDDQNIYEFRGSDSGHMRSLIEYFGATKYEMKENYRSRRAIVALGNAFIAPLPGRMKTQPIESVQDEDGIVEITRHPGANMEEAVAGHVARVASKPQDKVGVLTSTNDEALQIVGLLTQKGIRAKLIQSNDGFALRNLAEVRYFLGYIDSHLNGQPVIGDDLWTEAKKALERTYGASACLPNCRNLIRTFETTNKIRFRTDLESFVCESNFDDFSDIETGTVFVSTVHKAKGREFDKVFLLVKNVGALSAEERRRLYVAITRAKKELYIHCNTRLFDGFKGIPGAVFLDDSRDYREPEELHLMLTHRDVYLDWFKGRKDSIARLRSGAALSVADPYLLGNVGGREVRVARFSKAFSTKLANLAQKGYKPAGATAGFVVAWKGEEDVEETYILLPTVRLHKPTCEDWHNHTL